MGTTPLALTFAESMAHQIRTLSHTHKDARSKAFCYADVIQSTQLTRVDIDTLRPAVEETIRRIKGGWAKEVKSVLERIHRHLDEQEKRLPIVLAREPAGLEALRATGLSIGEAIALHIRDMPHDDRGRAESNLLKRVTETISLTRADCVAIMQAVQRKIGTIAKHRERTRQMRRNLVSIRKIMAAHLEAFDAPAQPRIKAPRHAPILSNGSSTSTHRRPAGPPDPEHTRGWTGGRNGAHERPYA